MSTHNTNAYIQTHITHSLCVFCVALRWRSDDRFARARALWRAHHRLMGTGFWSYLVAIWRARIDTRHCAGRAGVTSAVHIP